MKENKKEMTTNICLFNWLVKLSCTSPKRSEPSGNPQFHADHSELGKTPFFFFSYPSFFRLFLLRCVCFFSQPPGLSEGTYPPRPTRKEERNSHREVRAPGDQTRTRLNRTRPVPPVQNPEELSALGPGRTQNPEEHRSQRPWLAVLGLLLFLSLFPTPPTSLFLSSCRQ